MTRCRGASEGTDLSRGAGSDLASQPDSACRETAGRESPRPLDLLDAHLTALAMAGGAHAARKRPRP